MNKYKILDLTADWRQPAISDVYPNTDFVIVLNDGKVLNFNTEFGKTREFKSLEEFKERVGLDDEEFEMMYIEDWRIKNRAKREVNTNINKVYIGDM